MRVSTLLFSLLLLLYGCSDDTFRSGDTKGTTGGFTSADGNTGADGQTGNNGSDGQSGVDGQSGTTSCVPKCEGKTCGPDGCGTKCGACPNDKVCNNSGQCVTQVEKNCQKDSDCPTSTPKCAPQGVCIFCYPGTYKCENNQSLLCEQFGKFYEVADDCNASGGTCNPVGGKCESGCGAGGGGVSKTNAGCEFYAVDLRNAIENDPLSGQSVDAQNAQFAVIASNTTDKLATVTVKQPDGLEYKKQIQPKSLEKFLLPKDFGFVGSGKFKAFHIVSNQPITAYQFNPLSNVGVFSNDASVLLPVSGLGKSYRVVTRSQLSTNYRGYFSVVGLSPNTTISVRPSAATVAGGGIAAISANQLTNFTIGKGEALSFESATDNADLTGSLIDSNQPIAVFAGHVAATTSELCCADHLEQQMAPTTAWGKEYAIARSMERGKEQDYIRIVAHSPGTKVTVSPAVVTPPTKTMSAGEYWEFKTNTHVKITASAPVMVAQFLASSMEVDSCNSNADCLPKYACTAVDTPSGKTCQTDADCPAGTGCAEPSSPFGGTKTCGPKICKYTGFLCLSDAECGPGHVCYQSLGCSPIGDPALILAVPQEQWQTEYIFLAPDSYAEDYVNIVTEAQAVVMLDNQQIPSNNFVPVPSTNFVVYRTKINDGMHTIKSDKPCAIVSYGYDKDVSYGYPGGLGLKTL